MNNILTIKKNGYQIMKISGSKGRIYDYFLKERRNILKNRNELTGWALSAVEDEFNFVNGDRMVVSISTVY